MVRGKERRFAPIFDLYGYSQGLIISLQSGLYQFCLWGSFQDLRRIKLNNPPAA